MAHDEVVLTQAERASFDALTARLPRFLGARLLAQVLDGLAHLGGMGPSLAAARCLGAVR